MPNPTREEVEAELAAFTASQEANAQQAAQQSAPEPERTSIELDPVAEAKTVEPIAIEQVEKPASNDDERKKDPEYWEHRFKTLEGIARKEKEELARQQQAVLDQNNELIQILREQQLAQSQANIAPAPILPTKARDVTDEMLLESYSEEEIEEYGAEALRKEIATENRLQAIQNQVEAVARTTQEQQEKDRQRSEIELFWKRVEKTVPDAELMNRTDAKWSAWLDQDYRREMLGAAMAKGDADAVARAMATYKAETAGTKVPSVDPALPSIEEQAIPGSTVHIPEATKPRVTTYTRSQVDRYYEDRQRGRLAEKYSQAEILQLENQIKRAALENRVVPG